MMKELNKVWVKTCAGVVLVFLFPVLLQAQDVKPTTGAKKMVTLLESIKQLNKEKGVYFLFSDSAIGKKMVSGDYDVQQKPEEILQAILKGTGLGYKKIGEKTFVILDEKEGVQKIDKVDQLIFNKDGISYVSDAASVKDSTIGSRLISGEVVNAKDNALMEGVTIRVKGKTTSTISAANGTFSINSTAGAELECTKVGFTPRIVKVGRSAYLQINLDELYNNLGEVVMVAYGTQKKSTYTGAASNVALEMVDKAPRASVQESLQGNVPGVISTNGSGQPGSVPSVRIRGIGSINASSAPLYVVDGIPIVSGDITGYNTNTLSAINSSDIESFVVLKDASATALYGSRGANGVILITTKKGKAGKTKFNFSFQNGNNLNAIADKNKTLNTQEAVQYLREAWANSDRDPKSFTAELGIRGVDTTRNTDWFNQILRNGRFMSADLNISGGTDKNTFYLSGGYYKSDAVQKGVGYEKATLRLNVKNQASAKLLLTGGIGLAYQQTANSLGGSYYANPIRALYRLQPWLSVKNEDGSFNTEYNNGYNPVAIAENTFRKGETYYINSNVGFTYNFSKALSLDGKAAIDYNHGFTQSYSDPRYGNTNVTSGGAAGNNMQDITNWITTTILRYKKEINRSTLEAFAGYEVNKRLDKDMSLTVNQVIPGLETASNGSLPVATMATITANSVLSSFFNVNYDYDDRYYVTGSYRRDGSSRFGRDNRFGDFWSIGGGWTISKEKFFNLRWLNELRLRGSYGATGNQTGIDNFGSLGLYSTANDYNAAPGYVFTQFENNTLTWEKNYPLNVGVDFTLANGRVRGTLEYYNRQTKSLLLDVLVPATNGISSYFDNYGKMSNAGFETGLSFVPVQPKKVTGFKWTSDIVFSTNVNKIISINAPIQTDYLDRQNGLDFYQWYVAGYAGVDPATGQALWYKNGTEEETTNSFGSASRYDQGSALPTFTGSLKNAFSYKGFSLMFQLYVNWGNKVRDIHGVYTSADGSAGFSATGNVSRYNYEHRWQNPGDITDVPKPVYLGKQTGLSNMMSSRFLYDGSYIRLRDVMVSYSMPRKLVKKLKLTSSRVYVRANNLYTWVKDKRLIFDPEVPVGGTMDQRPPVFATVLAGIDINF